MGNSKPNPIQQSLAAGWKLTKETQNVKIYQHSISHDHCQLTTVFNIQAQDLETYSSRKIYSFVHTPNIYNYNILKDPRESKFISSGYTADIEVLVQSTFQRLSQLQEINNSIIEEGFLLRKFEEVVLGFQYLLNRYGCFRIKANQIGWTSNKVVKVWLNQNFALNKCDLNDASEAKMIEDLFYIFREVVPFFPNVMTFSNLLKMLQGVKSQFSILQTSIINSKINIDNQKSGFRFSKTSNILNDIFPKKDQKYHKEVLLSQSAGCGTQRWIPNSFNQSPLNSTYSEFNFTEFKHFKKVQSNIKIMHQQQQKPIGLFNHSSLSLSNINQPKLLIHQLPLYQEHKNLEWNKKNRKVSFKRKFNQQQVRNTMESVNISLSNPTSTYHSERRSTNNLNSRINPIKNIQFCNSYELNSKYHLKQIISKQNTLRQTNFSHEKVTHNIYNNCLKDSKLLESSQKIFKYNNSVYRTNDYTIKNIINEIPFEQSFTQYDSGIKNLITKSDNKLDKKYQNLAKVQNYQKQNNLEKSFSLVFQDISQKTYQQILEKEKISNRKIKEKQQSQITFRNHQKQKTSNLCDKVQNEFQALFSVEMSNDEMTEAQLSYNELMNQLNQVLQN